MIGRNRDGAELFVQISHKSFRNIGLIGRPDKYSVVETLCLIHDHLITLGLNPVFDQETAQLRIVMDKQLAEIYLVKL